MSVKLNACLWCSLLLFLGCEAVPTAPSEVKPAPYFQEGTSRIRAVAMSPDGKRVAWVHRPDLNRTRYEIVVLQIEDRAVLARLPLQHFANTMAFSPDGKLLVVDGDEVPVQVWETVTWSELPTRAQKSPTSPATYVLTFAPAGDQLAIGTVAVNSISLWDPRTFEYTATLGRHPAPHYVDRLAFFPDGKRLVSQRSESIIVWDVAQRQELWSFTTPENPRTGVSAVNGLVVAPDGRSFYTAGDDGVLRCWDSVAQKETAQIVTGFRHCHDISITANGQLLAATFTAQLPGQPGEFGIWDAQTGQRRASVTVPFPGALQVRFSPDGTWLAVTRPGVKELATGAFLLWRVADLLNQPK